MQVDEKGKLMFITGNANSMRQMWMKKAYEKLQIEISRLLLVIKDIIRINRMCICGCKKRESEKLNCPIFLGQFKSGSLALLDYVSL